MHRFSSINAVSLACLAWLSGAALAEAPVLNPVGPAVSPTGPLGTDISGMACLPPTATGARRCLVVNDESTAAQFVTLDKGRIAPGETIALIGDSKSSSTLGREPAVTTCPKGKGDFDEFDGEGVAYAEPYFYVVGSHGCSRKKDRFKLSSFILARIRVDGQGRPVDAAGAVSPQKAVETTYRLSDILRSEPRVGPSFGTRLMAEKGKANGNGLNVEGIAVIGTRLFVGLRAPNLGEPEGPSAYIVAAALDDLFAPGHEPSKLTGELIPLALGPGTGIRDLAPLPDGRLLVLAGPTEEQPGIPYRLVAAEPRKGASIKEIGVLAPLPAAEKEGKAEAVLALGPDRVLVLFDSLEGGGPREYELKLE